MERKIVTKQEAIELGLKRFYTGFVCGRGHFSERLTSNGVCIDCSHDYSKAHYVANRTEKLAYARKQYQEKKEYIKKRLRSSPELMEKRRQRGIEYRKVNGEKAARRAKEWRFNHKQRCLELQRRWQKRNKSKLRAAILRWEKKNPEKTRARLSRHRSRRLNAKGSYTGNDIKRIYKMQRGKCAYCRRALRGKWQVDHIIPLLNGGTNEARNIQLLCYQKSGCNQAKGSKDPIDFAQSLGLLL